MAAPQRMGPSGWIAQEPGWSDFVSDVRRLYRRNRSRPLPFLICVLLCTVYGYYRGNIYRPNYEARIALRLTEQDVGVAVSPRPAAALRAFITDVALSDRTLIRIMERHNLYQKQRLKGVDQALESLREDLGVEVWRNEFLIDDANDPLGRSARVALSYTHQDPETAFAVVQALADATIAENRRMRMAQVEYLTQGLEPAIEETRQQLLVLRLRDPRAGSTGHPRTQGGAPLAPQPPSVSPLGLPMSSQNFSDAAEIEILEKRMRDLIERRSEAELRLRAETRDLALRLEVIDIVRPQAQPYHTSALAIGTSAGLLGGLLVGGLLMRAFDRRVYEAADITNLGLPVCGVLPAYPGDDVGSMKNRTKGRHPVVSPGARGPRPALDRS